MALTFGSKVIVPFSPSLTRWEGERSQGSTCPAIKGDINKWYLSLLISSYWSEEDHMAILSLLENRKWMFSQTGLWQDGVMKNSPLALHLVFLRLQCSQVTQTSPSLQFPESQDAFIELLRMRGLCAQAPRISAQWLAHLHVPHLLGDGLWDTQWALCHLFPFTLGPCPGIRIIV